jgi:hypothetical protein
LLVHNLNRGSPSPTSKVTRRTGPERTRLEHASSDGEEIKPQPGPPTRLIDAENKDKRSTKQFQQRFGVLPNFSSALSCQDRREQIGKADFLSINSGARLGWSAKTVPTGWSK